MPRVQDASTSQGREQGENTIHSINRIEIHCLTVQVKLGRARRDDCKIESPWYEGKSRTRQLFPHLDRLSLMESARNSDHVHPVSDNPTIAVEWDAHWTWHEGDGS